jgi:hypothetical protein
LKVMSKADFTHRLPPAYDHATRDCLTSPIEIVEPFPVPRMQWQDAITDDE